MILLFLLNWLNFRPKLFTLIQQYSYYSSCVESFHRFINNTNTSIEN